MSIAQAPSRPELRQRATELIPLLQRNASRAEEERRLPQDTIDALAEAGILRMRVPTRFGGFESDMRTTADVVAELARGDGSTGWTVAVWMISSWVMGLFPDAVQDEVFSAPDVRVSGILSPSAVATPTDGGVVINGRWAFNTGCQQSSWNTNAAVLMGPDGPEPVMVAIPMSDLQIVDDWFTSGLRGSGSVTTVAKDVFVPRARVLSMIPILSGQMTETTNAYSPVYRALFMPMAATTVSATAMGLAKAARDAFFDRLPGRKITYTSYEHQSEAPLTHLQTGDATMRIDEAEFHVSRAAEMIDNKAAAGEEWTIEERAHARLDLGATCLRAKEAVDIFSTASGGSSIHTSVPIQRIDRDVRALNLHAIMHPDTNFELYGRVRCGLDPNTQYL